MSSLDLHHSLYLPRYLMEWQTRPGAADHELVEGTLLFADISGFTTLSEQLATRGRIGSEHVTDVLNGAFSELLDVAALDGGDLLSFGGDALLLMFHGNQHAERAAHSAFEMRAALDEYQETSSPVPLAISIGVASGTIALFLAGSTSRELIAAGPVVDDLVEIEGIADAGEILLAPSSAALLDNEVIGASKGHRLILGDAPEPDEHEHEPPGEAAVGPAVAFDGYLPAPLRKHLTLTFNEGEHRLANVAFIKLAGLGAITESRGLAGAGQELDRVVGAVQDIADRFGVSFLASDVAADGVKLILATGVPERTDAEEDRILRAVGEISQLDTSCAVTAGVARGNVFAGDLGSRTRRVYTIIGDTVNLAARLATAASPGEALVTESILDRAKSLFDVTRLPPMTLKGISKPLAPYRLGAMIGSGAGRAAPRHPLIGRDTELSVLIHASDEALRSQGSVIDLVGPAGVGKTRLLQELVDRVDLRLVYAAGEPYETATAFHVAGQIVRNALNLPEDKDAEELGGLLLDAIGTMAPRIAPWSPLLALVTGARVAMTPEVADLGDSFQTQKTNEVIEALLRTVLTEPTLIIVDSAEWADAASLNTIEHLLGEVSPRPWLTIISRRPGDTWPTIPDAISLELGGLAPDDVRNLLAHAVGDAELAVPVLDEIALRSGGTPFFLLALARAAVDGEDTLPESIEAAAAARIDRLDLKDRRMLRYAAALGRQFSVDMLADSAGELAPMLDDRAVWDRLGEFLEVTTTGIVRFRQPIMRDVAYSGLPYGRRIELHAAIGEALERRARQRPERYAELLSLHFAEAQDDAKTWTYAVMAAERASRKHAPVVAVEHYRKALAAARKQPDVVPAAEVADAAEALGDVADRAGLLHEAWAAYEEADALAGHDPIRQGRLRRKEAMVKEKLGEYGTALELLDVGLDILNGIEPSPEVEHERLDAQLLYAGVLNRKGENEQSVEWCLQVLDDAERAGYEAGVAHASNLLETNYTDLNHPDRGSAYERALEIYRDLGDLVGEAKVLNNLGYNDYFLGDWSSAAEHWEASAAASSRAGDIVTAAMVMNNLAEIDIDRGLLDDAAPRLEEALRIWRGARFPLGVAFVHANLGRVDGRTHRPDSAAEHLDAAERTFSEVGSTHGVLDVRMRRIEVWLVEGDWPQALPAIDEALTEAESLAGSTVLRAGMHRLRGFGLLQASRPVPAREALDTSLALAIEARARFEEGLTLHALSVWAATTDEEDLWAEPGLAILDDLGVISPPPIPAASSNR